MDLSGPEVSKDTLTIPRDENGRTWWITFILFWPMLWVSEPYHESRLMLTKSRRRSL
jgi:hypothetical protein